MRKKIIGKEPATPLESRKLDVRTIATVLVNSEKLDHPIENAFDTQRGPQEIDLLVSQNGGNLYWKLLCQFSRPRMTFEWENRSINAELAIPLRLLIKPDKSGKLCRATLTSRALR